MGFDELLKALKIDEEYTLARFSGMKNILERFLLRFLDDNSMGLLKYDFETNDQESAERDAHTLKGLAANLGLDELSRRAAECVDIIRAGNYAAARQQYPHILEEYERVVQILKKYADSLQK